MTKGDESRTWRIADRIDASNGRMEKDVVRGRGRKARYGNGQSICVWSIVGLVGNGSNSTERGGERATAGVVRAVESRKNEAGTRTLHAIGRRAPPEGIAYVIGSLGVTWAGSA